MDLGSSSFDPASVKSGQRAPYDIAIKVLAQGVAATWSLSSENSCFNFELFAHLFVAWKFMFVLAHKLQAKLHTKTSCAFFII